MLVTQIGSASHFEVVTRMLTASLASVGHSA